ncbi:MAG TPA: plastocyanin/azurin family copper-binding protein [Candidatus Saccharimonadales bacterium]|nr:plastocyanin/azurin family copper-binding protein [Candidatus Saccharimonadales bacterium]
MGKTLTWIIVLIIIIGGGWLIYRHYYPNGYSTSSSSNSSTTTSTTSSTPSATNSVSIMGMAFQPADITVAAGTAVTWTNNDTVAHTVTESDGQTGPTSGTLNPGQTYTFTFANAGTFAYHCTIHSSMTGTVTVTQ